MVKTIVKKKDLQKLISESLNRGKRITSGTPQLNWRALTEDVNNIYNKIRIGIIKEGYPLNLRNYTPLLTEDQSEWAGGRNPGSSAASGIEEIIKSLEKAHEMWKETQVGDMIKNSIIRLYNTMTVIGTYVGSGQSQRKVDPEWLYSQLADLKPITNKKAEGCEEGNADSCEFGPSKTYFDDF
tara:strand:- start:3420 stop:3968 length:549 start_codon:yes stop_codon:yes gene_type:complete